MVIRMRHTRAHTKNRRSHHGLTAPTLAVCSNCSAHHRPHHMCQACGFYKGQLVIDMTAKKAARTARMNAKKEAIKGQQDSADNEAGVMNESGDVRPENVPEQKTAKVTAPTIAKAKTSVARKV